MLRCDDHGKVAEKTNAGVTTAECTIDTFGVTTAECTFVRPCSSVFCIRIAVSGHS